jgi:hypothetical protein
MDLNHRPHPYQGCALTELSYGPGLAGRMSYGATRHPTFVRKRMAPERKRPPQKRGPFLKVTKSACEAQSHHDLLLWPGAHDLCRQLPVLEQGDCRDAHDAVSRGDGGGLVDV